MPLRQRPYYLLRQLLRQPAKVPPTAPQRSFVRVSALRRQQDVGGSSGSSKPCPSIFAELFPGEAREPGTRAEVVGEAGVGVGVRRRLDDSDAERWLLGDDDDESQLGGGGSEGGDGGRDAPMETGTASAARERSEPTVLVLSGTTPSLLASDFFRIAPRAATTTTTATTAGRAGGAEDRRDRIDGWAAAGGGLYKVVQDRDPATLAPRGRYFLYFGSSAAALAYAQEVRDLHGLARRAVQAPRHRNQGRFREAAGSLGETGNVVGGGGGGGGAGGGSNEQEEAAALRSFSLLPPTAKLDLAMHLPDGTKTTTSGGRDDDDDDDDVAAADTRTKVLLVLEDVSGGGSDHGSSSGGGGGGGVTTIAVVRDLLATDGSARNLPWAVSPGLNGVVPVRWLVAEQRRLQDEHYDDYYNAQRRQLQKEEQQQQQQRLPPSPPSRKLPFVPAAGVPDLAAKTDQMDDHASFSRFVVTLPDPVEARRFVRSWHRRIVSVPTAASTTELEATALVDATVLW